MTYDPHTDYGHADPASFFKPVRVLSDPIPFPRGCQWTLEDGWPCGEEAYEERALEVYCNHHADENDQLEEWGRYLANNE